MNAAAIRILEDWKSGELARQIASPIPRQNWAVPVEGFSVPNVATMEKPGISFVNFITTMLVVLLLPGRFLACL